MVQNSILNVTPRRRAKLTRQYGRALIVQTIRHLQRHDRQTCHGQTGKPCPFENADMAALVPGGVLPKPAPPPSRKKRKLMTQRARRETKKRRLAQERAVEKALEDSFCWHGPGLGRGRYRRGKARVIAALPIIGSSVRARCERARHLEHLDRQTAS